jgi:hypothetical protein
LLETKPGFKYENAPEEPDFMGTSFFRLPFTVLLAISSLIICPGASVPRSFGTQKSARTVLKSTYGQLPLVFEPNIGQTDPRVRFLTRARGMTVFFTDTEAVMVLSRSERPQDDPVCRLKEPPKFTQTVVRMKLAGAQPPRQWTGLDKQPGISNYFIGNDPKQWRTGIPNYGRAEARGVYPGVDLIAYGNQGQLEYDLAVAPGADPTQVQLAWEGIESLRLNADGDLVLATQVGDVVQKRPRVYQEIGGKQVEVASKYVLAAGNQVRFELARYDRSRRLWIDPVVLAYSTYLGGSGFDYGYGIALDTSGAAYITGATASANFPTHSSFQPRLGGSNNAFVTKLAADGMSLVYSTYLGGNASDVGTSIAVDYYGYAYITGGAISSNFPVKSATQPNKSGVEDAFVTRLDSSGALVYSTYLGGDTSTPPYNFGTGIAVGYTAAGSINAYVTGVTSSTGFPTTASAYQTTLRGNSSAFVTSFASNGSLVFSTYLGGSSGDEAYAIAADDLGWAYVTGQTNSTDFPTTNSAYQATLRGSANAFVAMFNAAGTLMYSTYLGGSGYDVGYGIAVEMSLSGASTNGFVYLTGNTTSSDFPTTPSAFQNTAQGFGDAFVTGMDYLGDVWYSTYLGGDAPDSGYAIAVDKVGNIYVTGVTLSSNFPTQSAYQDSYQSTGGVGSGTDGDAFVTKLPPQDMGVIYPAGNQLIFSTYLGGNGADSGHGIAVDADANAYITGETNSSNFPTQSAYQNTYQGDVDAFVTKLSAYPTSFIAAEITGPASGSTLTGPSITFQWNPGAATTGQYTFWIGTKGVRSTDIFVGTFTGTSGTVSNLPTNGSTLYVSFICQNDVSGAWSEYDYTYTAATTSVPPALAITTLSPSSTYAGNPAFTLVVNGSGFVPQSFVQWNGSDLATTYVSSTQLTSFRTRQPDCDCGHRQH